MPKRLVVSQGKVKHIILPYSFSQLGIATLPSNPMVAVPLFDNIKEALTSTSLICAQLDSELAVARVPEAVKFLQTCGHYAGLNYAPEDYVQKLNFPFLLFRGEHREEHGILPSMYRCQPPQSADNLITKRRRIEARCIKIMQAALTAASSTDTARAAARHYGAPSCLLDFSFSPQVAAHFAHPPFSDAEKLQPGKRPVGIIYCLDIRQLIMLFPMQGWKPIPNGGVEISFYSLSSQLAIPYLSFNQANRTIVPATMMINLPTSVSQQPLTIRAIPVPEVKRVAMQQGVFVEIYVGSKEGPDWHTEVILWHILYLLTHKWCFFREDSGFNNPSEFISAAGLFPDDGPVLQRAGLLVNRLSQRR